MVLDDAAAGDAAAAHSFLLAVPVSAGHLAAVRLVVASHGAGSSACASLAVAPLALAALACGVLAARVASDKFYSS